MFWVILSSPLLPYSDTIICRPSSCVNGRFGLTLPSKSMFMDDLHIVLQMLQILGVVMVGFLATKRGVWAPEMNRKMSVFVLTVTAPLLILSSVMGEGLVFETREILQLLLVSALNYVILIGGSYVVTAIWHLDKYRKGLLRFMLSFGNVTFIGFPVLMAIFGERAVFYGAVLTIPFNLLIFTVGVEFVAGSGSLRGAFHWRKMLTPCVMASLAAVVLALFKVAVPSPIGQWCHLIGDMTIPCALLIIGSTLSQIPVRDMVGNRFVYTMAFLRLLLVPMLVLLVFKSLGFDPMVTNVATVLSGMPVAANGIMFCLKYGRDERLMAQAIFLSTLFSVVTVPFLTLWLS